MTEWAEGWIARQVRLAAPAPFPADDPDLRLCLGDELRSLGRRYRNCAGQRQAFSFLGDRLIYEWTRPGEAAVLELLRMKSGGETRYSLEDLLGPSNRRVKPDVAAAVKAKLDQFGILYQSLTRLPDDEQALHKLLDHHVRPAWDERAIAEREAGDAILDRMLDELEEEVHGREAA